METDFSQFEHLTDVFGSMPFIKRYSLITLMFQLSDSSATEDVVAHLEASLDRLAISIPYFAGRVVYVDRDATHSGIRKIVPHKGEIPLIVKDLTIEKALVFEKLRSEGFPMSMLDPEVLVPPIAITWAGDEYDKLAPVLILQANFVAGGLLLTIAGNHSTMDMTGLGIVIAHIAKACRNESFREEEVRQANQDRRNVIPLYGKDFEPGNELDDSLINPNAAPVTAQPSDWSYLSFSPSSLATLKQDASKQDLVPYISTDDAISALFWQRISAIRSGLYPDALPSHSRLARTVSARAQLNLTGYIGHMVDCVYAHLDNIQQRSLGNIAGELRILLRNTDSIVRHTRAFATVLDRMDDKSQIISGAQLDPNWDMVVSSYGNLKSCALDFGAMLAGQPVAARRPRMAGWPSLCYIMPADQDGRVSVAICLPEKEMLALRQDDVMRGYARYDG